MFPEFQEIKEGQSIHIKQQGMPINELKEKLEIFMKGHSQASIRKLISKIDTAH